MAGDAFVADVLSQFIAETAAMLFSSFLLLTAALLIGYGLHWWGYQRGWNAHDLHEKRERVRAAWLDAHDVVETVPLPAQRDPS